MLLIFSRDLFSSSKFSLFEIENNTITKTTIRGIGIKVMIEILLCIKKKYKITNKIDLNKTVNLNTLIIEKECMTKFKKLIFD